MRPGAFLRAIFLAGALVVPHAALAADVLRIGGRYRSSGHSESIVITMLGVGIYRSEGEGWIGVGLFDGSRYWGAFRIAGTGEARSDGVFEGRVRSDGSIIMRGEVRSGPGLNFDVVWSPDPPDIPRPESTVLPDPTPEPVGSEVIQMPEPLTRVPPVAPDCVRQGTQGVVIIQARVGADGRVKETRVTHSIPCLDAAAVEAVRQWVFKPGLSKGRPVATWVAVPVKFALH